MKGFRVRVSNLISFNISHYLHQTNHHIIPPSILRSFSSSSSYNNNRSNDGYSGSRRRSGDGNNDRFSGEYRGRKPSYSNDSKYRSSNRVDNRHNRKFDDDEQNPQFTPRNPSRQVNDSKYRGSSSYVPFHDDDEQNSKITPVNPKRQVNGNKIDNKIQDVDGFLDRFKLGFDQETNKLNSGRVGGEGEMAAEEERPQPPQDADDIFRKMKETGLIPNAVAMLHGLCQDGLVQDAMKLFGVMRERGSIPEVVIYTAVVEGFCKAHKQEEAIRIFRKMQSKGIVPNAFSYGVLVQGLIKGKQLDDGLEFCLEMVEAGYSPNLVTFTGLVNAFCRERGLESVQIVIGKLKDKGFGFDEKGVRDFMEKKGPFSPMVWEAIFGKKKSQML